MVRRLTIKVKTVRVETEQFLLNRYLLIHGAFLKCMVTLRSGVRINGKKTLGKIQL
jgi:hypothetical protein